MKSKTFIAASLMLMAILIAGCTQTPTQSADVKESAEKALSSAGLNSITVAQDRDKGVLTLSGTVASDSDKQKAADAVKAVSGSYVIANEIGVRPVGFVSEATKIDSSLDTAIEKNFEAIMVAQKLAKNVKYESKNSVLTLTGEVNSQSKRSDVEHMAAGVPNVKQVVNNLQVKGQKATSTN